MRWLITLLLTVFLIPSKQHNVPDTCWYFEYQEKLEQLTRIVRAECNPHSKKDKLYMVQLILNREARYGSILRVLSAPRQFQGYNSPRYKRALIIEDYHLIDSFLREGTKIHDYEYVLNPKISTDEAFKAWAAKQKGEWVGNHWYFME